jgi:DNA-binding CsgD family transcriptional regulator
VGLTWPLTGRSEHLRVIETAFTDDDLVGIVISGAAGVGKSRLAREAVELAASRGCETRWVVGTSSARKLPVGAFAAWVEPSVTDPLRLVRSVIDAMTSAAPGKQAVIGVDDVHLLDDLSTFVVHQIVQRRAARVILTVRDGDQVTAATREIWNNDRFDRLDLPPLTQEETTTLLSAALEGYVDPGVAHTLWNLTRGNILYLRNIVEREIADQRLTQRQGRWTWTGRPSVPPSLVDMVESRIGTLPLPVSNVVDALAVGEPIELAALGRITDPVAVEEADRRGLIVLETIDGNVEARLAHPLYGEVRRRRAPMTSLRRLRGLVAAELAKSDGANDIRTVVRRAALTLESDLEPDAGLLLRAAQGAVWLADLPLADRLSDAAIRAGAGAEARFVRAHVLSFLSRGDQAVAVLDACPSAELTDDQRARFAFLRCHILLFTCRKPELAKQLIDEAKCTTPPASRHYIDAFLSLYASVMGKPKVALELFDNFVLQDLPGVIGTGTAMAVLVAHADTGHTTEAVEAAHIGYAIAKRSFDAEQMRFIVADGHVSALLQAGWIADARELADRLHQEAADLPGPAQLLSGGQAGMAALAAGQLPTACNLLARVAEPLCASGDTTGWGYRYQLPHTVALSMRGSVEDAAAALAVVEEQRHPTWRYLDHEYALAQAWVAAAAGRTTKAVEILHAAAETAETNGRLAAEVLCLQTVTQFGDRSCASRLQELAATVEGPRAGLAARFASAVHNRDGAELAAVSKEFERMGDVVAAADAAAYAASAYRYNGRRGSAYVCGTRARSLAQRCGGLSTPALLKAADRVPVSDREREIIMLIGDGLSSRAVAQRLTLSARTVEGHIYRAMSRTGAATRQELVAMLEEDDSAP